MCIYFVYIYIPISLPVSLPWSHFLRESCRKSFTICSMKRIGIERKNDIRVHDAIRDVLYTDILCYVLMKKTTKKNKTIWSFGNKARNINRVDVISFITLLHFSLYRYLGCIKIRTYNDFSYTCIHSWFLHWEKMYQSKQIKRYIRKGSL